MVEVNVPQNDGKTPILINGYWQMANKAARDKFLAALDKCARQVKAKEPGVPRYAFLIPRDESDETTLYTLEEFDNQAYFDSHMKQPFTHEVMNLLATDTSLFGAPGEVNFLKIESWQFNGGALAANPDPFVVIGILSYQESTVDKAVPGWNDLVAHTKRTEPTTTMFVCSRNQNDPNMVRMIEAYEDEEAFKKHCATKEVQDKVEEEKAYQVKPPVVAFLKLAAGFLHR